MESVKEKMKKSFKELGGKLGISNLMASPKITKVVLSSGTGKIQDKRKKEFILERITKISGQRAVSAKARKSIASFKSRQGEAIGVMVTLRGDRMIAFLDKLIHVAIPRMRDFKGISPKSIDAAGNITIGIPEHTIFPETGDDDPKDAFGFAITIVTSARKKAETEALLRFIGLPLREK